MTERDINNFIDRHSFYPVRCFDVKKFCFEHEFRPCDVDHIDFDDGLFCFVFKKYFPLKSMTFTNITFLCYQKSRVIGSDL